jgi:hypothetical protein
VDFVERVGRSLQVKIWVVFFFCGSGGGDGWRNGLVGLLGFLEEERRMGC